MPLPRIGITMDVGTPDESRKTLELPLDYANAVLRNGGLPLLLPITHDPDIRSQMLDNIDALIVPGGDDLDPKLYGQTPHPKTKLADPDRQTFDLAILALAEQRQLPTLGICMGCQTMNVQRRGTLHQHLPDSQPDSPIQHRRVGDRTNFHDVTIHPGTKLAHALKLEQLQVNSRHHQGIAKLGHGLIPTALAPDGLIEAFEDPTLPFWLAVQWHPENLPNTPHDLLFRALIAAAGRA
ncbi:MAG TPA: gamma-glutamyl-gamma-aminobutyrate hydrolase family protein [Phycisphaerae bacterium]|nr:gamma-glutamyl-gamma-aminobutyrate hydrolase family protein [Phycisphaerae bacterium]